MSCLLNAVPVANLVVAGDYLLPLSLVVASFLTAFFASVRTSDQLLSQLLISFSWNNVLQDQPVEEEVEYPTELLVQLGTEWSYTCSSKSTWRIFQVFLPIRKIPLISIL